MNFKTSFAMYVKMDDTLIENRKKCVDITLLVELESISRFENTRSLPLASFVRSKSVTTSSASPKSRRNLQLAVWQFISTKSLSTLQNPNNFLYVTYKFSRNHSTHALLSI
jgi:hypothetical protein